MSSSIDGSWSGWDTPKRSAQLRTGSAGLCGRFWTTVSCYEERGPAVTKARAQRRAAKMVRELRSLGYRIERVTAPRVAKNDRERLSTLVRRAEGGGASEIAMPIGTGSSLGPYEIQSALAGGGMGQVHRARHTMAGIRADGCLRLSGSRSDPTTERTWCGCSHASGFGEPYMANPRTSRRQATDAALGVGFNSVLISHARSVA